MSDQVVIQFSTAAPSRFPRVFIPFTKDWANQASWGIRKFGHSPFSHVDILLDPFEFEGSRYVDCLLGASDNPGAQTVYGNPRGVAVRIPHYQPFGARRRMTIKTEKADAILAYAKSQVGKPFDSGAVSLKEFMSDAFPGARDWRDDTQWFCAELVIVAFEQGGYWGDGVKLPWPKNRISPMDVYFAFMMDPNFLNRSTFFDPITRLKMGIYER